MALVVADTSPLRFLVEIGYEQVLPQLFQQVWIPGAVARELRHDRTPEVLRQWAERLPPWVHVREIGNSGFERLGKTKFRRTPELFAQTAQLARQRRERNHE